ncbi:hypothetical protein F383_37004 [Gossypium arboreum]|uniref:Uncharacterized protein n=1 Tax=Gossypium arboreum TaxID=29729 RepID=A0A0B0MBV9_GOSAR|nr:hypothetical protein F383_37004 [Gossypium arboreum]
MSLLSPSLLQFGKGQF